MPSIVASDGKTYDFPEEADAQKIGGYLKSKGLTAVKIASAEEPSGAMFSKPKGAGLTPQQRELAKRYATTQADNARVGYTQDIADAKAKFAGDVSTALPVAATLATGGLAAPLAIGVMGMAGAQSGVVSEGTKLALGSRDAATSAKQFAKNVGIDAVLGAATEIGGRMAGKVLEYGGKKVLMPLITKAAAKTDAGMSTLRIHGTNLMNQLRQLSSQAGDAAKTTVGKELEVLKASLALRKTGLAPATKEIMSNLAGKLAQWDGSLAGLAEIKGDISQASFKRAGMHFDEQKALTEFVGALDRKLTEGFKKIGGGEVYAAQKETISQLHRYSLGLDLAKESIKRMAFRMTYGAVGGAAYGSQHGGVEGAIIGGVAGGALAAGGKALEEKMAPWLLEKLLTEKTTAPIVRQAFAQASAGQTKLAASTFSRAVAQAGVRKTVAEALKADEAPAQ